ncbi:MAG: leucyl/phenylalanyl-tRNA--protein transferase [Thermodesulfobacteriota bacterium]
MPVYLLDDSLVFPDPMHAEPNGLLAVGGDLSVPRLLLAYRSGIFPWYSENNPILWFSPDPRLVLTLEDLYVSRKLKKVLKSAQFEVFFDTAFGDVIRSCSAVSRKGQTGTWITRDMIRAYTELHELGYAHSVETYHEGELAGGLYGVAIGGVFFGESMFHIVSDTSKVALYHLVEKLRELGFDFIDSQVPNTHMKRMGGREVGRESFLVMLRDAVNKKTPLGKWTDNRNLKLERL